MDQEAIKDMRIKEPVCMTCGRAKPEPEYSTCRSCYYLFAGTPAWYRYYDTGEKM